MSKRMSSSKTLGVTMGIGVEYSAYAEEAAHRVRQHLDLETFIIDERFLNYALAEKSKRKRVWSIKFSVFDLVPENWHRLMYFDADWRPVRDWNVDELFPDMDRIYVAPDRSHLPIVQRLEVQYGLRPGDYFNSGWMLLPRRSRPLLEEARRKYFELPRRFGDQCVLNQILRDDVTFVPETFNIFKPAVWPDPVNAMAVHTVNSDWNYQVYRGEIADLSWSSQTYPDLNETVLRGLDYSPPETIVANDVVDVAQISGSYRGGRALEIGATRGHFTLALALAGLEVTSYSLETNSRHLREGLLRRYGFVGKFWLADAIHELDQDEQFQVVLYGSKNPGDHLQPDIRRFWEAKVANGGVLIVRDVHKLDRNLLSTALSPVGTVVSAAPDGSELAYFLKDVN
jgi:hypothetical protein